MLALVHILIGLLAIIAVGIAVWRSTVGGSLVQAIGPWTAALVLLILYGVSGTLINAKELQATASTGAQGGRIVQSNLFPAHYAYEDGRDKVTSNQANTVVERLSSKGTAIAIGVWNGLAKPIDGFGVSIFVLLVGVAVIILAWRYLLSQNILELGMGLLAIAAVISLGAGSPTEAWFPRTAVSLANGIASAVVSKTQDAFVGMKRQESGQLSYLELLNAANHARVYPKARDAMRLYVASARQQGLPVEQVGMVGMDGQGSVPPTFRNKVVTYVPGQLVDLPVFSRIVAPGFDEVGHGLRGDARKQDIPAVINDLYETSGCYAIYLGGDPYQFIQTYLTSPTHKTIFFPSSQMPPAMGGKDQAEADQYYLNWQSRLVNGITLHIGVAVLDGNDGARVAEDLKRAIQTWYAEAKRLRLEENDQEEQVRLVERAGSGQTAVVKQQFAVRRQLINDWCMAPDVLPLAFKPEVAAALGVRGLPPADTYSLGVAIRAALWHSSAANPAGVPASPIIGRDGGTLAAIIKDRDLDHPDAWGVILRGLADGSYLSSTGTDERGIAVMRSYVSDIVDQQYAASRYEVQALGGLFSTPGSREFGRNVRVTGTEDTASWFDKIVGAVTGALAWLASFSIYYIVDIVVRIVAAIAVSWAPMVIGVSLLFAVALWPVVFCYALLPGRWTVFLDWFKVVMWIFAWIPVVIIGRGLIDADGVIPEGSYTYAVIQKMIGVAVILGAPLIAKAVIDPTVGGLSGVVGFALKHAVARAGMLTGGALAAGMTIGKMGKAGVGGAQSAGGGGSGGGGGTPAPAAPESGPAAASAEGSQGQTGPSARGSGGTPQGAGRTAPSKSPAPATTPGAPAAGQSFLQGVIGGSATAGRLGGALQAVRETAQAEISSGAAQMQARLMPSSPLSASDRMASAAVAGLSGDPLQPGNQWRGFGSDVSNRDVARDVLASRGGTNAGPRRRALAAIDARAQKGGASLGKSRVLASQARDVAAQARSDASVGDPKHAPTALVDAALAEAQVAEHEQVIADHPEAAPAERQAATSRAEGARLRSANHMQAAQAAAGQVGDSKVKAAVAAAIAAIASRLDAGAQRTTGASPKGTS